jgi:WXG100 family type VII secretion target
MPAVIIRCDYDGVKQMGQMFRKNGSEIAQVNKKVKAAQEALEGGDWIGQGAKAFYNEMNSEINPAMRKLASAMEEASKIVQQAGQIFEQADEEASRVIIIVEGNFVVR